MAKADANLYNEASRVVMVRHDGKTVISMMNDYAGELTEFAMVVPVPVVLQEGQIHIGNRALFDHIDAYSAPRLVEYFDDDPCARQLARDGILNTRGGRAGAASMTKSLVVSECEVKIEAEYTVGEYDIVILSAEESDGLERWLVDNGYNIPIGAAKALRPYIRQQMKFFVAKVNLDEQAKTGVEFLRPLQFAFESEKFMLPIRLGMLNADGPQELLLYVLTREGRVETTNYRTVKLPTGDELPTYVKGEFDAFYTSMFDRQVANEKTRAVFTEYFWNMGWCDPCAANPLSKEELTSLGVFWLDGEQNDRRGRGGAIPVMVTRLHVRYTPETFPEDLVFQETQDQQNFQGRYVLRHPWKGGAAECPAAAQYLRDVAARQEREAETLASLTGWEIGDIREQIDFVSAPVQEAPLAWWKTIWR